MKWFHWVSAFLLVASAAAQEKKAEETKELKTQPAVGTKETLSFPKEGSLDQKIATAIAQSPDVQAAEARVREAEAELRRARAKVAQDVVLASQKIETAMMALKSAELDLQRKGHMADNGQIDRMELSNAELAMMRLKTELDNAQILLRYMTEGFEKRSKSERAQETLEIKSPAKDPLVSRANRPPASPELSRYLETPVTLVVSKVPLPKVIEMLKSEASTRSKYPANFVVDEELREWPISLSAENSTVGQVLGMIADLDAQSVVFVVRPYGLYATTSSNALRLWGAAIPFETPMLEAALPNPVRGEKK